MTDHRLAAGVYSERITRSKTCWDVLVVDDDEETFLVTRAILGNRSILGRRIHLDFARSDADARRAVGEKSYACILLDVVMETDSAGLDFIQFVREELRDAQTRIVVRTGQPGVAPEGDVIERYEINDYVEKTELSSQKLVTILTNALRSYRDIIALKETEQGLRNLIDHTSAVYRLEALDIFAAKCLDLIITILTLDPSEGGDANGIGVALGRGTPIALVGRGRFEGHSRIFDGDFPAEIRTIVEQAASQMAPARGLVGLAIPVSNGKGDKLVFYVEKEWPRMALAHELLDVLVLNVAAAFSNILMYGEVKSLVSQRDELLREVHHRVQNNLQLILSLINLARSRKQSCDSGVMLDISDWIQSMAFVHDSIYESEELDSVDFEMIARTISAGALGNLKRPVSLIFDISPRNIRLSLHKAIPCALLFRELLSKALGSFMKESSPPVVSVTLIASMESNQFELVLRTNGEDSSPGSAESCYAELIDILTSQLDGRCLERAEEGYCLDFTMPLD